MRGTNFYEDEIDNPYLPLEEGSLWVYQGEDLLNSVFVTDREKEILGVDTTVVLDVEFSEGQLAELTLDWYAQDDDGNVWYFGENTAEIEDGEIVSREGSWEAGVDGAEPGIVMLAKPKVGQTYAEENAPGVAEDMATVISLNESVDVPFGSFDHVLQTDNFSRSIRMRWKRSSTPRAWATSWRSTRRPARRRNSSSSARATT